MNLAVGYANLCRELFMHTAPNIRVLIRGIFDDVTPSHSISCTCRFRSRKLSIILYKTWAWPML